MVLNVSWYLRNSLFLIGYTGPLSNSRWWDDTPVNEVDDHRCEEGSKVLA